MAGLIVVKIGGSLLRSPESYFRAAGLLKSFAERGAKVVAVVSAAKGATDELIKALGGCSSCFERLAAWHLSAAESVGGKPVAAKVGELLEAARRALAADAGDPRIRDFVLSVGERASKKLLTAALEAAGARVAELSADGLIVTDGRHGDASIDYRATLARLGMAKAALEHADVVVVEGFIGSSPSGCVVTLGRGGSDYTATALGALLGADFVFLVTDVDGVYSADPALVRGARLVPALSLREAVEAARGRVKGFNAKTFNPLLEVNPVRVVVGSMDKMGTEILPRLSESSLGPKIVHPLPGSGVVAIIGEGSARPRYVKAALSAVESAGVEPRGVVAEPGSAAVKVYVDSELSVEAARAIHRALIEGGGEP